MSINCPTALPGFSYTISGGMTCGFGLISSQNPPPSPLPPPAGTPVPDGAYVAVVAYPAPSPLPPFPISTAVPVAIDTGLMTWFGQGIPVPGSTGSGSGSGTLYTMIFWNYAGGRLQELSSVNFTGQVDGGMSCCGGELAPLPAPLAPGRQGRGLSLPPPPPPPFA
ncbi:hypothetical protein [Fimbriiglobus ruber]|uniref:Uncharacterized protein n=1 Tax=Fimbriiglobus ruber TaxID=1908690 RepID=A0A225DVG2_9BACT|nr:hypothetical protein [Fimbriiglobus ruber]OWK44993.1 hypothetical protein FRUB_01324 [Fimbriiglobus ruber]